MGIAQFNPAEPRAKIQAGFNRGIRLTKRNAHFSTRDCAGLLPEHSFSPLASEIFWRSSVTSSARFGGCPSVSWWAQSVDRTECPLGIAQFNPAIAKSIHQAGFNRRIRPTKRYAHFSTRDCAGLLPEHSFSPLASEIFWRSSVTSSAWPGGCPSVSWWAQ
jgi:hypothetical protein